MSNYIISEVDDVLVVRGTGEPLDLWNDLRQHYLHARRALRGPGRLRYPETSNRDVRAVITALSRELGRTSPEVAGYQREARAWARASQRAHAAMRDHGDDQVFADNAGFWTRDTRQLAVYLSVARHLPTRSELLDDFTDLTAVDRARSAS